MSKRRRKYSPAHPVFGDRLRSHPSWWEPFIIISFEGGHEDCPFCAQGVPRADTPSGHHEVPRTANGRGANPDRSENRSESASEVQE